MTTTIKDNSFTREGSCSVRSSKGMPILDETYSFIVISTTTNEDYLTVLTTPGLPIVNDTLSPSGYGRCRSLTAEKMPENAKYWKVVVTFSSEVDENANTDQPSNNPQASNPTIWVPIYETKFERLQEVCSVDVDGTPITNSALAPFPEGITRTRKIPVWEFFQFEPATVTDEQIIDRSETVNSLDFRGREPKTLLLTVLSSVIGNFYGTRVRLTQYQLKWKKDNWQQKRADYGYFYIDSPDRPPYTDQDGNVILGPLNGLGLKTTNVTDAPAVLYFDMYEELDFNDFLRV